MDEYQEAAKKTLDAFFDAARWSKGKVLDSTGVRHVAAYIQNITRALEQQQIMLLGADNMLAAYVNEYGEQLMKELLAEDIEVVEGEVVDDEEQATPGFTGNVSGLDTSEEE
jgi:hypothetical protein